MTFNRKQIDFLKKIGISLVSEENLTDDDYIIIEDKVANYLQVHGFDESYNITEEGVLCESILDML